MSTKSCLICGNPLPTIKHNRKYCRYDCEMEAKRRKARAYVHKRKCSPEARKAMTDEEKTAIRMRNDKVVGKIVPCLDCGKAFLSLHKGNRICPLCSGKDAEIGRYMVNLGR